MSNEITSWEDAADWTSEATLAGASICDCLNAVRLAILERINSINTCTIRTTEIEAPFEPLDNIRRKVTTLLDTLDLLCCYFVNTSDKDAQLKFDIGIQNNRNANHCFFNVADDASGNVTHAITSRYGDREYVVGLDNNTLTVNVTSKDDFVSVPVVFFNLYAPGGNFLSFCDAAGVDKNKYTRASNGRTVDFYTTSYDGCYLRSILGTLKDMYDIINLLTVPRINYTVRIEVAGSVTYTRSAYLHRRTRDVWTYVITDGTDYAETTYDTPAVSPEAAWEQSRWNENTVPSSGLAADGEATIHDSVGGFQLARHAFLPAVYTTITSENYNIPLSYSYDLDCSFRKTENMYLNEGHGENSRATLLTKSGEIRGTSAVTTVKDESSAGVFGKIDAMPSPDERNSVKYDWMVYDPELICAMTLEVLAPVDYAFRKNEDAEQSS